MTLPAITIPEISAKDLATSASDSVTHARNLFLRGLPAEAADYAHHAAAIAKHLGHEAAGPLKDLAEWMERFIRPVDVKPADPPPAPQTPAHTGAVSSSAS